MRWVRSIAVGVGVVFAAGIFSGCGTIGAARNLANGILGLANKTANKTLSTTDKAVTKAITPSTYQKLPQQMRNQPRGYQEPQRAKRTSARNSGALNHSSNSSRKPSAHGSGASYLRDKAKSSNKRRR
ncbi:MAG: hypothetical protein SGI88_11390 [Candidatus Hydrogenedentes bacterium]|nr:hypothetical protein [Candidatus Hydrogenedentota bacterium]